MIALRRSLESRAPHPVDRGRWAAIALAMIAIIVVGAVGITTESGSHESTQSSVSSVSSFSSALSTISSNQTCPQVFSGSTYPGVGNNTMKILRVRTGPLNQSGDSGRGPGDVWCIYDASSNLVNEYTANRVLGGVAASSDGSSVAATGWQILPGPAGVYANGLVCLFNEKGQMVWNITSSQPLFSVQANANNSVIVVSDPDLLYLDASGRVLWNYSQYESTSVVLVNNGSDVVAGVSQIPYPGHSNYGGALTMFDSGGRAIWNVTFPSQFFDSTDSLTYSNGFLAAGLTVSGYNGTVSYYDLKGNLVWSRYVDSAILQVSFQDNGSTIYAQTNWASVIFDLRGEVTSNQTAPH